VTIDAMGEALGARSEGLPRTSAQRRLGRNLCWMGAAIFFGSLIQYALYFWVARHLGPAEYGLFSVALTIAVLSGPFVDLGMSVTLVWVGARDPERLPVTIGSSIAWRCALTLPVGGLAMLVMAGSSTGTAMLALFAPLYLATAFDGLGTLFSAAFQARERMDLAASTMLSRNVLRAVAFGGALLFDSGVMGLAWWALAGSALGALWSWWLLRRHMAVSFERPLRWAVLRGAIPFGLGIVATMAHQQIDVVMLGAMTTSAEVGAYHAGVRFYILAQLVAHTVAVVAQPLSYRRGLAGAAASSAILRLKTAGLGILGTLGALLFALCADDMVRIALGDGYVASVPIVLATAPLVFLKFVSSPLSDTVTSLGRRSSLTIGIWLSLGINVLANAVLIPRHGALGAVAATAISETALAIWLVSSVTRSGVQLGWDSLLRHSLILVVLAASLWWSLRGMAIQARGEWVAALAVLGAAALAALRPTAEESMLLKTVLGRAPVGV
jgi:O-antigen/teichoic acid export membrane protein